MLILKNKSYSEYKYLYKNKALLWDFKNDICLVRYCKAILHRCNKPAVLRWTNRNHSNTWYDKHYWSCNEYFIYNYLITNTSYNSDGTIVHLYINNNIYRPSTVRYYLNGKVCLKEYVKNNLLHRDNGPAYQEWDKNGNNIKNEYYQNGIQC